MGPFVVATTTAFPLSTSLAGTSVAISAGGRTIPAIMFYSSAGQVSAIVPSSTPVGVASVTVTYNGRTSASFPMTIVQSTLGIFTATTIGSGDAIATLGSTFLSPLNAANPGEVVAFWGTGLGPVTSDETGPAQQADMTNVPVEAYVAGKPAEVVFRGRNSCCSAIDTIYVRIPSGVAGCSTPVVFKTGSYVSNTTTISTSENGRTCTPTNKSFTKSQIESLLAKGATSAGVSGAAINLSRATNLAGQITALADGGTALFSTSPLAPGGFGYSSWDVAQLGSCAVSNVFIMPGLLLSPKNLDAGATLSIAGPSSTASLTRLADLNYAGIFQRSWPILQPGAIRRERNWRSRYRSFLRSDHDPGGLDMDEPRQHQRRGSLRRSSD